LLVDLAESEAFSVDLIESVAFSRDFAVSVFATVDLSVTVALSVIYAFAPVLRELSLFCKKLNSSCSSSDYVSGSVLGLGFSSGSF
jgi:hypothetical protein